MEQLTARLGEELPGPEISRLWETQRRTFDGPELLFEPHGREVVLKFESRNGGRHEGLKCAFEEAIHRERPDCGVEWV